MKQQIMNIGMESLQKLVGPEHLRDAYKNKGTALLKNKLRFFENLIQVAI